MARLFDDAQNEFLVNTAGAPVVAAPFTMACWLNLDADRDSAMMFVGDKDAGTDWWALLSESNGNTLLMFAFDGGTSDAETSNAWGLNAWHHACGREISANSREAILDADFGNKGTNATNRSPDNADSVAIGMARDDSPGAPFSGRIAWPAIWNVSLTDDEITALDAGWHPTLIRPSALVAFWPLGGFDTAETDGGTALDIVGGFDLTAGSDAVGPGVADHPGGLIYPSSPLVFPAAVAAPVGSPSPRTHIEGPLVGCLGGPI